MWDKLIKDINNDFPFNNYMIQKGIIRPKYSFVMTLINNNFAKDTKILDFGSGKNDITAIIKESGYDNIDAYDDCNDEWYNKDNKLKLINFSKRHKINFFENFAELDGRKYDLILLLDVIEHVPQPKKLFNTILKLLNDNGKILITVPNSVSIRKRLTVLMGKTNYTNYDEFYSEDNFRGHWREYSIEDLKQLSKQIKFEIKSVSGFNGIIPKGKFKFFLFKYFLFLYKLIIKIDISLSDTLGVILEKK